MQVVLNTVIGIKRGNNMKKLYEFLYYIWTLMIGGDIVLIISAIANWGIPDIFSGIWSLIAFALSLFIIGFGARFND